MHSVRLEPTKLILIGTRTTYQATGDAGTIFAIFALDESWWRSFSHFIWWKFLTIVDADMKPLLSVLSEAERQHSPVLFLNPLRTPVPFWGQTTYN